MCLCLVFWKDFFWGQMAIQVGTSVALVILLGWYRPLESLFSNVIEVFNEVITLMILYLMMCFSDFVGDPKTRSHCGVAFIVIILFFVSVHILILTIGVYKQVRHLIRSKYYARRNLKLLKNRLEEKEAGNTPPIKQELVSIAEVSNDGSSEEVEEVDEMIEEEKVEKIDGWDD